MKIYGFVAVVLISISLAANAQTFGWRDAQGNIVPDSPSQKSMDGFGGWLLITDDADWEEKWNTPTENIPHFSDASTVRVGETVMALIFITNPARDADGNVSVLCDLEMTRPDGSISISHVDMPCMAGKLSGDPYAIYLAETLVGFLGEPSDPVGTWTLRVRLKDMVRDTVLDLEASFDFVNDV